MFDTETVKFSGSALASSLDPMGLGHVCIYPKNPGCTKVLSPGYAGKKSVKSLPVWLDKRKSTFENPHGNALKMKGQEQGVSYPLYESKLKANQPSLCDDPVFITNNPEALRDSASSLGSQR